MPCKSSLELLSGALISLVAVFALGCSDTKNQFTGVTPPPGTESPGEEETPIYVPSLIPSDDIGVFVTTDGDDGDNGTKASPFLTIQHALDNLGEKKYVFVAGGTYTANVTATGTGQIYGSYDTAFKVQDPLKTPTFMQGNSPALVVSATGSIVAVGIRFIPEAVLDAVTTVVNLGKLAIARSSVKGQGSDGCNGDSRAIYNEGTLKVQSSVIQAGNTDCSDSIGIENSGGDVDISLTTIQAGNGDDDSIGIYQDQGSLNVRGARIYSNMAGDGEGYGIRSNEGDVLVSNSTFKPLNHNSDTYGIYAEFGMFRVGDSVFDLGFDNVGENTHYGIYLEDGGDDQADLYGNEIRNDGGACYLYGIYVEDVHANISNLKVDFGENKVNDTFAGVADIDADGTSDRDPLVTDNSASFPALGGNDIGTVEFLSGSQQGAYRVWDNNNSTQFRLWSDNPYVVDESDVEYLFSPENDDDCTSQGVHREDDDESYRLSVKNSTFNMGRNIQIVGVLSDAYDDDDTVAPETNILGNSFNGTGVQQYVGVGLENGYIRVQNNTFSMTMNEMKKVSTTGWGIRVDGERYDPIVEGETQVWISDNVITGGYSSQKFGLHIDGDEGPGSSGNDDERMKVDVRNNQVECGVTGGTPQNYGRCVAMKVDYSQVAVIEDNDFFAGPQNPNASAEYQAAHFEEEVIIESRRNHYRTDSIDLPARITGIKLEYDTAFLSEYDRVTVGPTGRPVYPNCDWDDDEDDDEGPRCARHMVFGVKVYDEVNASFSNANIEVGDSEGANVFGVFVDDYNSDDGSIDLIDTVVRTGTAGQGNCFYDEDQEGEDDLHYDDCENRGVVIEDSETVVERSTILAGPGRMSTGLYESGQDGHDDKPLWITDSKIGANSGVLNTFGIFQETQDQIIVSNSLIWAGPAGSGIAYGWYFGRDRDDEIDHGDEVDCDADQLGMDIEGSTIAASGLNSVGFRIGECDDGDSDRRIVNNTIAVNGDAMVDDDAGGTKVSVGQINNCNFSDCDEASGNVESSETAESLSPF